MEWVWFIQLWKYCLRYSRQVCVFIRLGSEEVFLLFVPCFGVTVSLLAYRAGVRSTSLLATAVDFTVLAETLDIIKTSVAYPPFIKPFVVRHIELV